ncbi:MAG: FitA-like ribbon-helix-helix domain-containing protein [Ferrovibrio sp.]|jgi:plasmid stability protein
MASIVIRNIDDDLKARLRRRAGRHGRSMEEELREILRSALASESLGGREFINAIRDRLEPFGYVELDLPPRTDMGREPPSFD